MMEAIHEDFRNAALDAGLALLNSGTIELLDSGDVVLAVGDLSATAFASASGGVAAANSISSEDSALASGDAVKARFKKSDSTAMFTLSVSLTGEGGDIQSDDVSVVAGNAVNFDSLNISMAAATIV